MTTLAQVDIGQAVEQGLAGVIAFVPEALAFVVILAIGWLVARLLQRVVAGVLAQIGFDRAVERGGLEQALARTSYDPSSLLARLVFYAVMLFVLQLAVGVFGPNPISALLFGVIAFLPKIFVAIVIVVVAAALAAVVREVVGAAIGSLSYGATLANVAAAVVVVVGVFAALDQVEIAPAIVNGLFYALLATIVGVTILAVGGGGVQPMRQRWEAALTRVEDESSRVPQEARTTSTEDVDRQRRAESRSDARDEDEQRPTASQLRERLEEAGWPTFDDGR